MSVHKRYTNKTKTKFSWYFISDVKSTVFDKYGRPKRKQIKRCGFATKKEAEKAERDFLNGLEENIIELNGNNAFGCVINNFLEYARHEGQYSKGTISNYEGYYNNHMQMLKLVPIKNLTPILLQTWMRELHDKGVSSHVFNGCLKLAKAAFNYAIKLKQHNTNPFEDIKPQSIQKKLRRRFSTEQLKELLNTCQTDMPRFYAIFALATLTGMRMGEYSALKPCDIDTASHKIYVEKQVTRNVLTNKLKTHSSLRIVDISDKVLEILDWHINKYNIQSNEFLFKTEFGKVVYAKWIERQFEKLLELCGYDERYCRVHDLRGQYVDVMHLCGTPIEYISRQVGHSSVSVTSRVYTQILHELPLEANRKMDQRIFGA